ncbi:class I SAM-dependent methyltransferase [Candidatus Woesearchaeota archaeon]|nr:class I SAM-dependent methyltransferase [Candidatus Woesearchaeota archaeon]
MIEKIKKAFVEFDAEIKNKFFFVVRDTEKGIWGPSNIDVVIDLFKKIKLEKYKHFIDIGAGDGRIVAIASTFTNATGIESDKNLVDSGNKIIKKLNINAELICDDFFNHNFSTYDILFINPDKGFHHGLEDKLLKEMKKDAILLVYNTIFMPRFLKRGTTHWIQQVPITEFSNPYKST